MLMTVKEMQNYLRIGKWKAYELVNNPHNPSVVRVGRAIRINKDILERWLMEKEVSNE